MTGTLTLPPADAKAGQGKHPGAAGMAAEDLALVDDDLGKTDAELWNEMAVADGETPPAQESAADEAVDDDAGKEPAEGDTPPAKEKGAAPEGEAAGQETPPELDWSKAPPELRAEHEALVAEKTRLEQSERSQRGRVSALQRQHDELQRRGNALPGAQGAGTAKKGAFESEKGKAFATEYPDVAAPVAEELATVRAELTEAQTALKTIIADREEARLDEQIELLEVDHPDWQTVAADKRYGVVADGAGNPAIRPGSWLASQPRHVREAALRNAKEIVDAEEAADVVSRFKAFRSEKPAQEGRGDEGHLQAPEGERQTPQVGRESIGNSLSGKRQRQLASSAGTRSTGPGAAHGIPEEGSAEEIWAAYDRQDAQQAKERTARRA